MRTNATNVTGNGASSNGEPTRLDDAGGSAAASPAPLTPTVMLLGRLKKPAVSLHQVCERSCRLRDQLGLPITFAVVAFVNVG